MQVQKVFNMTEAEFKNPELFRNRIADFMEVTYGCLHDNATEAVKNALSFDYAVCEGKGVAVGVQCNLYRTTVYVGC